MRSRGDLTQRREGERLFDDAFVDRTDVSVALGPFDDDRVVDPEPSIGQWADVREGVVQECARRLIDRFEPSADQAVQADRRRGLRELGLDRGSSEPQFVSGASEFGCEHVQLCCLERQLIVDRLL